MLRVTSCIAFCACTVQYSTVQYSTVQYATVQSTARYSTAHSAAQYQQRVQCVRVLSVEAAALQQSGTHSEYVVDDVLSLVRVWNQRGMNMVSL